MTKRLNFTQAALTALQQPDEGRFYAYDTKTPGLALAVTANNSRSFYVCRRVHGKPQRVRLGEFPLMSAEDARKRARVVIGEIETGADPNADKQAARRQTTFASAWTSYLEKHLKPRRKPKTVRESERMYEKHLRALASRTIATITTNELTDLHNEIGKKHKHMANRVMEVVRAVINHARKHNADLKQLANPCEHVERFPEEGRERVLSVDESKRLRKALDAESDADLCDYIELLLETGQRRSNVENMRWSQLDLASGRWLIPGSEFKNGKPQNLEFTTNAVRILKSRANESEYVFGENRDFRVGWERIREAAKLDGFRRHDLRRTVGSRLAEAGANEAVIAKILGHASTRSTAVYMRIADASAKQALQGISGSILGPTKRREAAKTA